MACPVIPQLHACYAQIEVFGVGPQAAGIAGQCQNFSFLQNRKKWLCSDRAFDLLPHILRATNQKFCEPFPIGFRVSELNEFSVVLEGADADPRSSHASPH